MDFVLVCPKNDEESLQILKIAEALDIPMIVSDQPHGARLEKETGLADRIKQVNPKATEVVIVEIPGPEVEAQLEASGLKVTIIDHHQYDELDRSNEKSSLEQFLDVFGVDDVRLGELDFDAKMVRAVAAIDRGFVWELKNEPLTEQERKRALAYYRALTMELGPERREREEAAARAAWENRTQKAGVIVVESDDEQTSIRDALSFIVADTFGEPQVVLIKQGNRRLYVQDTDAAKKLHQAFGGFLFGGGRCWGILSEDGSLPPVDDVLAHVVE